MSKGAKNQILPASASDSDDSGTPDLECETCGLDFPSIKALQDHLKGKRHAKKLAQEKLVAKLLDEEEATNKSDDDEHGDDDLRCDVCDKSFSGHLSYLAHLKGAMHAKFQRKARLKLKMADEPGIVADDHHEDDDGDEVVPRKFATCAACRKDFSGPEPYAAHLKSAAHRKKVGAAKIQVDADDHDSDYSEEGAVFARCKACSKSFSGPIPYRTHMLSSVHRRNLERAKAAEEMRKVCKRYDAEEGFVCAECDKAFPDPLAFKSHLANNSHERARAKRDMKEFLAKYPEVVFVAPFGDYSGSGSEEGEEESSSKSNFYLICRLCEMSFSGPESARQHVKSKKHQTKKEKRLLMKVVKEKERIKNAPPDGAPSKEVKNGRAIAQNGGSAKADSGKPANGAPSHDEDADAFEFV